MLVSHSAAFPEVGIPGTFQEMYQNLTKRYMHFANVP